MNSPALISPLIKEVIEELLKIKKGDFFQENFDPIAKIILSGRSGFNAFLDIAETQLQGVVFQNDMIIMNFKRGQLRTRYFPSGIWKQMIPFVRYAKFGSKHKLMMDALPLAKSLQSVYIFDDIGIDGWKKLFFGTPVNTLRAPADVIEAVNELTKKMYIKLRRVEVSASFDHLMDNTAQNLITKFRIRCKSLKVAWDDLLNNFLEVILSIQNKVISKTVEHLELCFNGSSFHEWPNFKDLTEELQQKFPNLTHLKLFDDCSDYRLTFPVDAEYAIAFYADILEDKVREAEVDYKLSVEQKYKTGFWASLNTVVACFINNGFILEKNTRYKQIWVYEKKVSSNKKIKLIIEVVKPH